jgi:asparagine synthase (glutamine-hydrolysing)
MCGIAGTIGHNKEHVGGMLAAIGHRGKDNSATADCDNMFDVCLGHNRLSIIDLSEKSNQPLSNERYVMVYNGEIYNYKDLNDEPSDTLALFEQINKVGFGRTLLSQLNGMFAIAVYDKYAKKLYLAVDHTGQKPLYYHHDNNGISFASSVSALLTTKDKWTIDEYALDGYWALGSVIGEQSLFSGIKKLCGAYMIEYDVNFNKVTKTKWWHPRERNDDIIELVNDAIDKVKVADVPVCILLSGGIDSTTIASRFEGGMAVHLNGAETQYAKTVADKFRVDLKCVDVAFGDIPTMLCDYAQKTGEPSMAAIQPYIVSSTIAKYARVGITANGADELFGGYDRIYWPLTQQLRHIFRPNYKRCFHEIVDLYPYDSYANAARWVELMTYVQFDLNKTLDAASMCHTVEVRSPFLDYRLIEAALTLPLAKHKSDKYGHKHILKSHLATLGFDDKFLTRKKEGFSIHGMPANYVKMQDAAYRWCVDMGYMPKWSEDFNARDSIYTNASALAFMLWHEAHRDKIYGNVEIVKTWDEI